MRVLDVCDGSSIYLTECAFGVALQVPAWCQLSLLHVGPHSHQAENYVNCKAVEEHWAHCVLTLLGLAWQG